MKKRGGVSVMNFQFPVYIGIIVLCLGCGVFEGRVLASERDEVVKALENTEHRRSDARSALRFFQLVTAFDDATHAVAAQATAYAEATERLEALEAEQRPHGVPHRRRPRRGCRQRQRRRVAHRPLQHHHRRDAGRPDAGGSAYVRNTGVALSIGDAARLKALNGDITLENPRNDFRDRVDATAKNVYLQDANDLSVGKNGVSVLGVVIYNGTRGHRDTGMVRCRDSGTTDYATGDFGTSLNRSPVVP